MIALHTELCHVMTEHKIKLMTKLITKSRLTKLVEAQKPQSINKHNKTPAGGGRALICTLFCPGLAIVWSMEQGRTWINYSLIIIFLGWKMLVTKY